MKHQLKVKAKRFHDLIINIEKNKKLRKEKRKGRLQKLMRKVTNSSNSIPYYSTYPMNPFNSGVSQSHQIITGINEINQRLNNINREQVPFEIIREHSSPIIKEEIFKTPAKILPDTNLPNSSRQLRNFENLASPIHIKSSHSEDET